MEIKNIDSLSIEDLAADFTTVVSIMKNESSDYYSKVDEWIDQYDGKHEILLRQDKLIGSGKDVRTVEVAKLPIPMQKRIVRSSASFLFGEPIQLINNDDDKDDAFEEFERVWKEASLDYHSKRLARKVLSETRSAELFYIIKDDDNELKVKVKLLCKSNGDFLYPYFDAKTGDLIAFLREYLVEDKAEGSDHLNVEIYTKDYIYNAVKTDEDWDIVKLDNLIKKIPIIYYETEEPDWSGVQDLINRTELLISKNADTNDYFGSPAIVSKGQLKNAPEKGEVGKFFEILPDISEGNTTYGDLEYLTWDRAPEAVKLEYEMLKDLIYSMTSTPDLSFNNVKGIGSVTGVAMKFMFLDSLMKATDNQEVFGEGIVRRINLLKTIIGKITSIKNKAILDANISFRFQDSLPENTTELIDTLTTATGGKAVMTVETAVKHNPFVSNSDEESDKLKAEDEANQVIPQSFG